MYMQCSLMLGACRPPSFGGAEIGWWNQDGVKGACSGTFRCLGSCSRSRESWRESSCFPSRPTLLSPSRTTTFWQAPLDQRRVYCGPRPPTSLHASSSPPQDGGLQAARPCGHHRGHPVAGYVWQCAGHRFRQSSCTGGLRWGVWVPLSPRCQPWPLATGHCSCMSRLEGNKELAKLVQAIKVGLLCTHQGAVRCWLVRFPTR